MKIEVELVHEDENYDLMSNEKFEKQMKEDASIWNIELISINDSPNNWKDVVFVGTEENLKKYCDHFYIDFDAVIV